MATGSESSFFSRIRAFFTQATSPSRQPVSPPVATPPSTVSPVAPHSTDETPWMRFALKEVGVKEVSGSKDNPTILKYWMEAGISGGDSDEIAWCAVFTNAMLARAGVEGTGSAMAKSFLKWGKSVANPFPGCIVVLDRTDSPAFGHVGFFIKRDATHVYVLSGNQSNMVSVAAYPLSRNPRYRMPT